MFGYVRFDLLRRTGSPCAALHWTSPGACRFAVRVVRFGRVGVVDLGLEVSERDGWAVVAVSGEVDVATAPRLREQLIELVNHGRHHIVVDLDRGRVPRLHRPRRPGRGPEAGPHEQRRAGPGLLRVAHPQGLRDHRAHEGVPDASNPRGRGRAGLSRRWLRSSSSRYRRGPSTSRWPACWWPPRSPATRCSPRTGSTTCAWRCPRPARTPWRPRPGPPWPAPAATAGRPSPSPSRSAASSASSRSRSRSSTTARASTPTPSPSTHR